MRPRPGLVLALASGASFLAVLDITIVNLAISDLRLDYPDAGVTSVSWVLTLYSIVFAALLMPAGRLADALGPRRPFLIGLGVFTLGSLACAVSWDLPVLLASRAAQAVGAAAMIPASLVLALGSAAPDRKGHVLGVWSGAAAMAAALGPSLGGVLVDAFGWRSLFLINLPIGAVFVILAMAVVSPSAPAFRVLPDLLGTLSVGIGIGLLVLGITQGTTWHWGDPRTVGCLAGGLVAVAAAVLRSLRHPVPALEIQLWRNRTFARAGIAFFFYGAVLFAWLLVGVLFLTSVWHYSELKAGLAMSPGAVVAVVVAARAGPLVTRYGPRVIVVGGACVIGVTGIWMSTALPADPHFVAVWLPAMSLAGAGIAAVTTGLSGAVAFAVAPRSVAAAIGTGQTSRQLGGALGVAAMAAILQAQGTQGVDPFENVYLLCTVAAVCVAAAGMLLTTPVTVAGAAGTQERADA